MTKLDWQKSWRYNDRNSVMLRNSRAVGNVKGTQAMSSWHSYSSIYNMGHRAVAELLKGPVYVEEKVDGSQFSFGLVEGTDVLSGASIYELRVRSKGCQLILDAPEKMFTLAVETVKTLAPKLTPGWTYRGEYLRNPKHNALIYTRIPLSHIIIFDIETAECEFLSYAEKAAEAARLGLEVVPLLKEGIVASLDEFRSFLDTDSILGGQKIEGVVVKPVGYGLFGVDKKVLMGKFVSEAFKEVHSKAWREGNPTSGDILATLALEYTTQARWQKALQHLKESGTITDAPQDIGALMKEVPEDVKRECETEIKEKLFAFAWPHIARRVTHGLPQWYKELLLKKQFEVPIIKGETFNHRDGQAELDKFEKELTNEKASLAEAAGSSRTEDPYQSEPEGC